MQPLSPHHPRRIADLRRHRPRAASVARAEAVRTSDVILAVTGVAMLGGLCLLLASNLLAF